jgi:hypothetical protein
MKATRGFLLLCLLGVAPALAGAETNHAMMVSHHPNASFLGVQLTALTPELRMHFGLQEDRGVMVSRVFDDSPAFRAGLEPGDIITAIDNEIVATQRDLMKSILHRSEGDVVELDIWRSGRPETITAIIEQRLVATSPLHHNIHLDCEDDDDCTVKIAQIHHDSAAFDCGDDEHCRVEIRCANDQDCTCTANGEIVVCEELPGFHRMHGE